MPGNERKGQRAQNGTQEVTPDHQEALLCCAGDEMPEQRGCAVSSLEIFKSCLDVVLGTLL